MTTTTHNTRYRGVVGILAIASTLLTGCMSFPPPQRGVGDLVLADEFQMYGPTTETPDRWWERFSSPALNALVEEALSNNFTLQQAVARIDQTVAIARQNRAVLFPALGYSGTISAQANHQDAGFGTLPGPSTSQRLEALGTLLVPGDGGGAPGDALQDAKSRLMALQTLTTKDPDNDQTIHTESYGLGLAASYEVDLWGRLRSGAQASLVEVFSTTEDLYAAMQTVAGQVVLTWLDLLQVRQTIDLTRDQLATNETSLKLIKLRVITKQATALDILQQIQVIARTEAILPPLEAQRDVLMHELAILLGKAPRTPLDLGGDAYPEPAPLPDYGFPADLLARRPDVRSAGLRLQAADWRVSVAKADRLPALRLTGGFFFDGDQFDMIFDNWLATLAGGLTGPIFDAGRRRAEVDRTHAVANERLNAYRLVVLTSMTEVENALVQIDRHQVFIDALRRQLKAANDSHEEAFIRYRNGLNDYLPVQTALINSQNLERNTIAADHDLLVFRVQLHLALGGDWMAALSPSNSEDGGA